MKSQTTNMFAFQEKTLGYLIKLSQLKQKVDPDSDLLWSEAALHIMEDSERLNALYKFQEELLAMARKNAKEIVYMKPNYFDLCLKRLSELTLNISLWVRKRI